jgi:hypothetical protein
MELPIDTNALTFICAGEATPVVDFTSGRPKTDINGVPLFQLSVVAMAGGDAEVLKVKVPGAPQGITSGAPVRLIGFVAAPWTMKENSGVAYRAKAIQPATGNSGAVKGGAVQ